MITDLGQLGLSKKYTYAGYLTWQFRERVELIRGKVFKMPPAPGLTHRWGNHQKPGAERHGFRSIGSLQKLTLRRWKIRATLSSCPPPGHLPT